MAMKHAGKRRFRILLTVMIIVVFLFVIVFPEFGVSKGYALLDQSSEDLYLTVLSDTSVKLNWLEYDQSGHSFRIQMKEDDTPFHTIAEVSRTHTSYEVTGLTRNRLYVFRVMLYIHETGKEEPIYNEVVFKPAITQISPTDLVLKQISPTEIRVSWVYPAGTGFETIVERQRESETNWHIIAHVKAGLNRHLDSPVDPNTRYRYRIKAKYEHGVYSDYLQRSVYSAIDTPQFEEFYSISPSSIYLSWSPSTDATRYQLERKQKGETDFVVVATPAKERTYFTDSGVIPGNRYIYRIKALNANQSESVYSNEVEVSAVFIDISYQMSAIAVSQHQVELKWSDLGDRESTYEVWRFDQQYPGWRIIATLDRNANAYTDNMVGPDETYTYKIRARSAEDDSYSQYSSEAYTTTKFLAAPSNLKQTKFSDTAITLSWKDNSAFQNMFMIERKDGVTGKWAQVTIADANMTERSNLPITRTSVWFYRVGAYSSEYRSVAYSDYILVDNGVKPSIWENSFYHDPTAGRFSDGDASGNLHEVKLNSTVLKALENNKIVTIKDGDIVNAGEQVTRGEFVSMLLKVVKPDMKPTGSFDDVKIGHPYYEAIMQAAKMGFIKAENGNYFFPDRIVTRKEIALWIYDCSIANETPLPDHKLSALRIFTDYKDVPNEILTQLQAVFGENIMIGIGYADGSRIIGIERQSTREQAALVVYRYLQWLK